MVLSSQAPRSAMSRSYMSSRRRKSRRWPRWVVAAVALLLVIWWLLPRGQADDHGDVDIAQTPSSQQPPTPAAPPAPTLTFGIRSEPAPSPVAAPPPPAPVSPDTRAAAPVATGQPPRTRPLVPVEPVFPGAQTSDPDAAAQLAQGMELIAQGRLVQGRRVLSRLLLNPDNPLTRMDEQRIRDTLNSVNRQLVFSPERIAGDPIVTYHTVQQGDRLVNIARQVQTPYQFIEKINDVTATRLRAGQTIKLIRGPFHGRVRKSDFIMDVYVLEDDQQPIFISSYVVGLGEDDSTPAGRWVVTPGRKVKDPSWRNPRTGDFFASGDPANPIGRYWIALSGIDAETANREGYGIHGTIDPDSIGAMMSMGCIRLRDDDIRQLFYMLVEGHSTVDIQR